MDPVNQGQEKLHKIRNTTTQEEREVTQTAWRTTGKQLRAEGWVRVDDEGAEVPETEEPGTGG